MPTLETYAEYFPQVAILVVAFLLGGVTFGAIERRLWAKRIEQRLALVEAVVVEAAEEMAHPLYEVQPGETPLAPWERELLAQHCRHDGPRIQGAVALTGQTEWMCGLCGNEVSPPGEFAPGEQKHVMWERGQQW